MMGRFWSYSIALWEIFPEMVHFPFMKNCRTDQVKSNGAAFATCIVRNTAKHFTLSRFIFYSILFADIKGFTQLSSNLCPNQLVRSLNEVFGEFDQLAEVSTKLKHVTKKGVFLLCLQKAKSTTFRKRYFSTLSCKF